MLAYSLFSQQIYTLERYSLNKQAHITQTSHSVMTSRGRHITASYENLNLFEGLHLQNPT